MGELEAFRGHESIKELSASLPEGDTILRVRRQEGSEKGHDREDAS